MTAVKNNDEEIEVMRLDAAPLELCFSHEKSFM